MEWDFDITICHLLHRPDSLFLLCSSATSLNVHGWTGYLRGELRCKIKNLIDEKISKERDQRNH